MTQYNGIPVPPSGQTIEYSNGKYRVPDHPIIPFIEGDGTGRDIWKASVRVFDAAVEKAYEGKRAVAWYEVFAGEKAKGQISELAARRYHQRHPRIPRRHQRTAHHARSAAASARSTSPCARSSTSTPACVRSSTTAAFRRR